MTQYPHILIIGGGLIGIANARTFITRGAKVTLIEQQASIGRGAGYANSGMIRPSQAWPWVESGLDETVQLLAARRVAILAKNAPDHLKQRMQSLSLPDIDRSGGCYQIFDSMSARNTAKTKSAFAPKNLSKYHAPHSIFPMTFQGMPMRGAAPK